METKRCSGCGETKPVSEFNKQKDNKDGLRTYCKVCHRANVVKWRVDNPDKKRVANAEWSIRNPDKVRASNAKYRANNLEKVRAANAKCRAENPEKERAYAARKAAELAPGYIANTLRIPVADLTPELLELKREQILTTRAVKQLIKEIQNAE